MCYNMYFVCILYAAILDRYCVFVQWRIRGNTATRRGRSFGGFGIVRRQSGGRGELMLSVRRRWKPSKSYVSKTRGRGLNGGHDSFFTTPPPPGSVAAFVPLVYTPWRVKFDIFSKARKSQLCVDTCARVRRFPFAAMLNFTCITCDNGTLSRITGRV